MSVDYQQLTLKLFTFWLPCLWSRMKISNIFFPVVSCQTLFAQSASPIWPGMLDGSVQKEQCVHTEMQPSLIDPLRADLCFVLSSVLSYSVCIPFRCILYSYTAFLLAFFPLCKQIF
ncbi:unnamed protein product [Rangifer tarandus platyrhynchus]|uniref:Uncharacterized protein n=2 Tax=Rangifer tarandus platyrhynchus TaxID=3082113 RepID=A0AC60A5N4_RANTA|nr:unnamed protein product [Rangifer tarandus platyrhynchus]